LQHAQKGFIGIDDTLAFNVSDENPQNVGVDQSTDLIFGSEREFDERQ
jgi:hypothetical protein